MMPRKKIEKSSNKPLTLSDLIEYNEDVLFPALEARFVTKDEFREFKDEMCSFKDEMCSFKDEMCSFKDEMYSFKKEFQQFKDDSLTGQDAILKKLDILIDEKVVADYQWEKNKKLLMFLISKLKDREILSDKDLAVIKSLEVF